MFETIALAAVLSGHHRASSIPAPYPVKSSFVVSPDSAASLYVGCYYPTHATSYAGSFTDNGADVSSSFTGDTPESPYLKGLGNTGTVQPFAHGITFYETNPSPIFTIVDVSVYCAPN